MPGKKTTISQLMLTDDVSKLASEILECEDKPVGLCLIAYYKNDAYHNQHTFSSSAELIGVLSIILSDTKRIIDCL